MLPANSFLEVPSSSKTVGFGLAPFLKTQADLERLAIPTEKAVPPWKQALDFFNQVELRKELRPKSAEEAEFLYYDCLKPWIIKLNWFYKKTYDSSHKISWGLAERRYYKYHGDVLVATREICKELHARKGASTEYPDAGRWFLLVLRDQFQVDVQFSLERFRESDRATGRLSNDEIGSKKTEIKNYREQWINELKAGINPFRHQHPEFCKHWRKFISMSLDEADRNKTWIEKGNVFRNEYWRAYIKAESKLLTEKDKNDAASISWYEDGKIYKRNGKGKGRAVVKKIK